MIQEGTKIKINQDCFKLDWVNAKAMIRGYNGGKIKQSIYCVKKEINLPKLITYNRSRSYFAYELSTIGRELNSNENLPSYQYIAMLEKQYQINNDENLWKIVCNNTLFDVWNWKAPFDLFNKLKSRNCYIALLRIYKIKENFENKFYSRSVYIDTINNDVELNVTIESPVILDDEFYVIQEILEDSIDPYLFGKRQKVINEPLKPQIPLSEIKEEDNGKDKSFLQQKYLNKSNLNKEIFEKYLQLIERKKQIIFQGAPGTGKSYLAQIFTNLLAEEEPDSVISIRYRVVQFHPSYSYEDFIQGYRPDEGSNFKLKSGLFLDICESATSQPDKKFVLLIDEINRGNLSKIFGELIYLLEYRNKSIKLTYSAEKDFKIPENLYIIGTMNTADRSLAMVDYALRRRFGFIDLKPDYEILRKLLKNNGSDNGFINQFTANLQKLNDRIEDPSLALGSGFEIGHSYFVKELKLDKTKLDLIWEFELSQLLDEYLYDNREEKENLYKILFDGL
jgi:hypothetical protein